jgi:Uma2 family endonuclease
MLKARMNHRFSVPDFDRMIDTGILTENDAVELIRGEILDKKPIGDAHSACVKRLRTRLGNILGDRAVFGVQDPIRLAYSEPEPDVTVLAPRNDFYASGKPVPDDVFLLVEVSDSTLDFDRNVKGPICAEAGIREYWIVNLVDDCVEVHRDPQADGSYRDIRTVKRGDRVGLSQITGAVVEITDLLA